MHLFPKLLDLKEYKVATFKLTNCWQHKMKSQHFVSIWCMYPYICKNSSTHGYQESCFVPSSEQCLFSSSLHRYCRTSALGGHQQSQPHGKHSIEWKLASQMSQWDSGNYNSTPLCIFLQNSVHCLTCPCLVPLPGEVHIFSSEVFVTSTFLFPPGHWGTLRLPKHSDRSCWRDHWGTNKLHQGQTASWVAGARLVGQGKRPQCSLDHT